MYFVLTRTHIRKGVAKLAKAMGSNKSVKELFLWGNKIGDEGAVNIASFLSTHPTLEVLGYAPPPVHMHVACLMKSVLDTSAP